MKRTWLVLAVVATGFLTATGCSTTTDEDVAVSEADLTSEETAGALMLANTLSESELRDDVKLHALSVKGILKFRSGPDGTAGTSDDKKYRTLSDLQSTQDLGPNGIALLAAYWREHYRDMTANAPWLANVPDGNVEMYGRARVLVRDDGVLVQEHDVAMDLVCRLTGKKPGVVKFACAWKSDVWWEVPLAPNGSFSTLQQVDKAHNNNYLGVSGKLSANLKLQFDKVEAWQAARCQHISGPCNPSTDFNEIAVIHNVEPAEGELKAVTLGDACLPQETLAYQHMVDGFPQLFIDGAKPSQCGVCYTQIRECDLTNRWGIGATSGASIICLHNSVPSWHGMTSTHTLPKNDTEAEGCAPGSEVYDFECHYGGYSGSPTHLRVCTGSDKPPRPIPPDVAVAARDTSCPSGYRQVGDCGPTLLACGRNDYEFVQGSSGESGWECPAGYAFGVKLNCKPYGRVYCAR